MKTNQATKEAVNQIEWDVIDGENTEFAVTYPRMQWVHGSKQAAGFMKNGGLFISKDQYPNFTGEGFTEQELIPREGENIAGYAAPSAELAVIRVKHQWVKDEEHAKNVPLCHALCVVKGCDDLLVLSLRGPSKALEFQKAFNSHIAQVISVANRTRPEDSKALEPFALWFRLRAGDLVTISSKDGKAKSVVTPLELVTPETNLDRDYVVSLWVGKDNYKQFASFWRDTAAWQKAPIWEQRNGEADLAPPEHTGGLDDLDPATPIQIEHIVGICMAKGLSEREVMLGTSQGEYESFRELSKGDARFLIQELAKQ